MYKLKLFLLPVALLLAFMALACAPPDDDAPFSGPTIKNAIYDVGKALLTVQGTNLSPTTATQAQIKTIKVYGVAFSSYTADEDATGEDSSSLAKGKYRIKTDGTKIWLRLKDEHKTTLNGKTGMDKDGLKKGLLSFGSGAWAGLDIAKDLVVKYIPAAEEDEQAEQAEEQSPKQPKDEQAEQAEEESPKQTEDEQAEQAEEQSPKQPKDEQAEEIEEQSPKQPKDEQVEQAEEESPKAAITRAIYHVGTAILTVQGSNLSPTEAQIQTIKVYDLVLSSYIADEDATGEDSRSLAKGKYRIKNDGTTLWLRLKDEHKTTLNGKTGMDSNGLKDGLLSVGTGAWADLDTAKDLTVSGNPAITRASYDVGTALLTVQGTLLGSATQAQIQTIKVYDLVLSSYTADDPATGPDSRGLTKGKYRIKNDGTAIWLKLTDQHKATLNGKDGMDSDGLKDGLLSVGTGAWAGLNTAKPLAVVNSNAPTITRATYDVNTDVLVITGTNLPSTVDGWDFSKLKFVSGSGLKSQPLQQHSTLGADRATGSAASGTLLVITLKGTERSKFYNTLRQNGDSDADGAYNLEAAAGFAGGSAEDTSNNPITVSGYVSHIANSHYYSNKGELRIFGTRLPTTIAEWDFSKLTIVSGDGKKKYTLPEHATAGENTATGSKASANYLVITLSGSVKAKVDAILVKAGDSDDAGEYNLKAAAGFVPGIPEDPTISINVR